MRDIKCRGKRHDNNHNNWIYGYLHVIDTYGQGYTGKAIQQQEHKERPYSVRVKDETIGQYTGLKDRNGKEIFEGDVVRTHFSFGHEVTQEPFVIKWNKERAMFEGSKPKPLENDYLVTFSFFPEQRFLYEIIGNIHDNPELLEVPNGKED